MLAGVSIAGKGIFSVPDISISPSAGNIMMKTESGRRFIASSSKYVSARHAAYISGVDKSGLYEKILLEQ